jgi:hypothetical protein
VSRPDCEARVNVCLPSRPCWRRERSMAPNARRRLAQPPGG